MKISDLETIIHTYSTQYINPEELMYLQIVEKLKKWNLRGGDKVEHPNYSK